MADEVTIWEQPAIRNLQIRQTPPLAVQTIDIDGSLSDAFSDSTKMISIRTTTDCDIEFSNLDGTAPDGAGAGSGVLPLLAADGWVDIEVRAGDKVIAVS